MLTVTPRVAPYFRHVYDPLCQCSTMPMFHHITDPLCYLLTPLSHERLVANAHELGTSKDSLETSQDGLGCVLARPCMSRQVTETEREIPFFSHRLVAAVDFILSREINSNPPPPPPPPSPSGDKDATKLYWPVPACPS